MPTLLRALLITLSLLLSPWLQAAGTSTGIVLATAGAVEILRDSTLIPAARKTVLHVDDEIRTGEGARAQLRFADGTVTTLGANTVFRIAQFDWQDKPGQPANASFSLVKGAFRTVTGKALEINGSRFEVTTPNGSLGIRGTDFWGGYLDADAVDVLLISGEHAVVVTNTSGTVTLEKAGQGTTLKADQSALAVKEWPQAKVDRAVATITWPDGSTPPTE